MLLYRLIREIKYMLSPLFQNPSQNYTVILSGYDNYSSTKE